MCTNWCKKLCVVFFSPYSQDNFLCRKVIGEFVCDKLVWVVAHPEIFAGHPVFYKKAIADACVPQEEAVTYSTGKGGYGWHISALVIYDKPKEVSADGLPRPPQSWCYVEERSRQ